MFGIVRMLFWCAIFLIYIFRTKKSKIRKRKNVIVVAAVILLFWIISGLFPIENYFITFSTPERAYNYMNFEKVKLIIEGNKSAFVIGKRDIAEYDYLIVPKKQNGWGLGRGIDSKLQIQKIIEGVDISLYQYKNSNEYYIIVSNIGDEKLNILDSCNSQFIMLNEDKKDVQINYSFYCASISNYDENYWISVNGNQISLSK